MHLLSFPTHQTREFNSLIYISIIKWPFSLGRKNLTNSLHIFHFTTSPFSLVEEWELNIMFIEYLNELNKQLREFGPLSIPIQLWPLVISRLSKASKDFLLFPCLNDFNGVSSTKSPELKTIWDTWYFSPISYFISPKCLP